MELLTILNRCHRFRGFVYQHAHFSADKKSIEVAVRPRKGSAAVCSRCHLPAPGYDQLAERRFEFIPLWGFLVFLLYTMRRVNCRRCGIVAVEEVPWGDGKRTLSKAYMLFLARWARRLSWKETAEAFRTSWDKVFDAVEHVVTWGLEHRVLGQIDAIGVDEIQYAFPHRTHEEDRPFATQSSRTHPQLFPRSKAAFQWRRGGPEQQGQSHYEKIVRLSHLPRSRTRPVSLTWQAARTGVYPRFLLTSLIFAVNEC